MGGRKRNKHRRVDWATKEASGSSNFSVSARNLRKSDLGAVIFGCTRNTINECFTKKLFGLPGLHFSYIKNISEGLVLFLFNYSDRKLHGIFEAAGPGQMNIDSYAWPADGDNTGYTSFPAQVRIRDRRECQPLSEAQFKPIIADNYHHHGKHFHFELDHAQTRMLIQLFEKSPLIRQITRVAPLPTGVTTDISYASALGKSSTLTATAPSFHPTGTWSSLFKTQPHSEGTSSDQCGTQTPNGSFSASGVNEDKGGFLQANAWEENQPIATNTWGDESSPQEYEDKVILQENAWEESQWLSDSSLKLKITTEEHPLNQDDAANGDFTQENTWGGEWEESQWVSDSSLKLNTTTDEHPLNQDDEANGDFMQETTWGDKSDLKPKVNTWGEECDQFWEPDPKHQVKTWGEEYDPTWESDLNPQVNTSTDNADFMQENSWEESQPIPTTTDKAENVETWESDSTGQPSDDNQDCNKSSSNETNESEKEENNEKDDSSVLNTVAEPETSTNLQSLVIKLMDEVKVMKGSQMKQIVQISVLEKGLVESKQEIQHLKNRLSCLEFGSKSIVAEVDNHLLSKPQSKLAESVFIAGAYDGSSWLSTLDSYCPSNDTKSSLNSMQFVKKYASAATFNGELYHSGGEGSKSIVAEVDNHLLSKPQSKLAESVFIAGGYDGSSWLSTLVSYCPSNDTKSSLYSMQFVKKYASAAIFNGELYHFGGEGFHSVESYNPSKNKWVPRPPLFWKNIHVAGASVKDRLFVVGGANGRNCSSEVEYLDLTVGKWVPTRSMLSKRLAPAIAELNNALYVTGGYDGATYLSSVERFDPREEAWSRLPSMNTNKGCHSMVVLKEKLYTIGGFNGDNYVPTLERFDTRMGSWVEAEPMNVCRGNFGAFVLEEKLYTIGGVKEDKVLDIVECYKEGSWEISDLKGIGKRSHFSALVA